MNRETKRLMKRGEGESGATERRKPAAPPPHRERTTPKVFIREVKGELRKVAWPTRPEVINSTIIVLVAVVVMTTLIFGMDYAFAKSVLFIFE